MADPIADWHEEHLNFGRLFALLQKQIDVFHTGKLPNYELMLDIVSYLRDYSDQFHHPREEVAFKLLAKHCPDLTQALDRLTQEHRVIAHAGEALRLLLQAIISGAIIPRAEAVRLTPPLVSRAKATIAEKRSSSPGEVSIGGAIIPRAEVEMAAATYLVYYGNHIAREEEQEDILGRAVQALTKEEWEDVKTVVPTVDDPLSPGSEEVRYRELRRQLALTA